MKFKKINNTNKILIIVIIVGLILRIYRLGYNDLWYDEITSLNIAGRSFNITTPPLYYFFLNIWMNFFSNNEFYLRLPSLFFSVLSMPLTFILGKKMFNSTVAIFATALIAINPFNIWYAQEIRPYSLTLLLSLISTLLFFQILINKKIFTLILFSFVGALGFYTKEFFIILFFCQLLFIFVFFNKIKLSSVKLFFLFIPFFVFLPRLKNFFERFHHIIKDFWLPEPSFRSFFITLGNLNIGYNAHIYAYILSNIIFLIIASYIIFNFKKNPFKKDRLILLFFLFFLPVFLIFIFSKIFFSIYIDRAFLIFSPYYYLFLSLGIYLIKSKHFKIILISSLVFLTIHGNYNYFTNNMPSPESHRIGVMLKKPVKPAAEFISRNYHHKDLIAYTHFSLPVLFDYYLKDEKTLNEKFFIMPSVQEKYWIKAYINDPLNPFFINLEYQLPPKEIKTIWLVSTNWQRDGQLDENSKAVKNWMDKNYNLSLKKEFQGIFIFKYNKTYE